MCPTPAYSSRYSAHRPLQPAYAEHRIRALGTRDKQQLGRLVELLSPLIKRHYDMYMHSKGFTSFVNRRLLSVDIGVESPGDFSKLLFDYFEVNQFQRLATYDEVLMTTDFRRGPLNDNGAAGFASFCSNILSASTAETRFIADRLSDHALSLCGWVVHYAPAVQPIVPSLQESLLALLNRLMHGSEILTLVRNKSERIGSIDFDREAYAALSDEQRYRLNWRLLKKMFTKTFSSYPPAFSAPVSTKYVAVDEFAAQLYTLDTAERAFFESRLDANEQDALHAYVASPGVRSSIAPHVVCREINALLATNSFNEAACFEPHVMKNAYNAGILKLLAPCTEPAVRNRLQLHFNRSLLESAFRTEIIDSLSKFEKWVSIQFKIIARTLSGRLSQVREKKRHVSLEEFNRPDVATSEETTNPFLRTRNLITSHLENEMEIRIMTYKFVEYFGNAQIAERMRDLYPQQGPWHRKKVANVLGTALDKMRHSMASPPRSSPTSNRWTDCSPGESTSRTTQKAPRSTVSVWDVDKRS